MKKLVLLLFLAPLLFSCGKELETVTVNSDPSKLFAPADSIYTESDTTDEDDFVHIKLGEIATIESLDPLFASSNSEWRMINLLYDGLVGLNKEGEPTPNLVKRWEVNRDSTQFTLHLRTNIYFHDSPVFGNGTSRRFTARDVRFIFERMASNDVPDFTASHFSDIRGFTAYHNEHTYVKLSSKWALETINGIKVQNDSTIIFALNQSAPDFLNRLAHPMASVYAHESVPTGKGSIQQAAGTGAFRFINKENNAHLLTSNKDYHGEKANINRLDIISGLTETNLFQRYARNDLHALIELGPSSLLTVADSTGNLFESYYQDYVLTQTSAESDYPIYFNKNSGQTSQVNALISELNDQDLFENSALGTISIERADTTSTTKRNSQQLIITQTEHPHELFLYNSLATQAASNNLPFSINTSYAIWDDITFTNYPFPNTNEILRWTTPVYILTHDAISGIELNHTPWNLDLSSLKLTEEGN